MVVKLTERDHGVSEFDAQDLFLYICNTAELYHKLTQPIIANLKRKVAKGVYDKSLALKSWKHLADEGARLYDKEFGSGGSSVTLFSPETRMEVARRLQDRYEENILGEGLDEKVVKKSNGKWTNRYSNGKNHGEFNSRAAAARGAQAMFAAIEDDEKGVDNDPANKKDDKKKPKKKSEKKDDKQESWKEKVRKAFNSRYKGKSFTPQELNELLNDIFDRISKSFPKLTFSEFKKYWNTLVIEYKSEQKKESLHESLDGLDTPEELVRYFSNILGLSDYDADSMLHDIYNLRGYEWIDVLEDSGCDEELIDKYKEIAGINWIC